MNLFQIWHLQIGDGVEMHFGNFLPRGTVPFGKSGTAAGDFYQGI